MNPIKKWILAIFLLILCLAISYLSSIDTYSNNTNNNNNTTSLESNFSLKNNSDDMPKVSSTQYIFNENRILNQVVIQGNFIHSYKRIFTNNMRNDYNIESTYNDFNNDFEEYRLNLKEMILSLQSENPALNDSKNEQTQTLKKLNRLYDTISDYKNHNTHIKDTLKYLKECENELNRINNQSKLPTN